VSGPMTPISASDLHSLLVVALVAAGFSDRHAQALARQTVLCEQLGQPTLGVSHVFDYVDGLAAGRINGKAVPKVSYPAPTMVLVDGDEGLPQTGFDATFDKIVATAQSLGICAFLHRNATTCGALGTFALRVAEAGLVCFAATNGPPLLAGSGSTKAVYCTNPMAFSAPQDSGPPLLIDQSSSQTAMLNIREAARVGADIPFGWAVDSNGDPTNDPKAALDGSLLAFGGARGANIALMVEVLAAGLTGANWSLDAPSVFDANRSPATGLFVLAINPAPVDTSFAARLSQQLKRLQREFGIHIPGLSKPGLKARSVDQSLNVDSDLLVRLRAMAN